MSVLLEFAMFPTDKGESVSHYVSRILEHINNSGFGYNLTAMGTIVETETVAQALSLVERSYQILEPASNRVYVSMNMDIRKGKTGRLQAKVNAIRNQVDLNNQSH